MEKILLFFLKFHLNLSLSFSLGFSFKKNFIFFLILFSCRRVQSSLHFGSSATAKRKHVELKTKKKHILCHLKLTRELHLYKSVYCHKRFSKNKRKKNTISLILTTSKKKRPPLYKGNLQIFIPLSKWGLFYFLD